jgi:hypothetical protein
MRRWRAARLAQLVGERRALLMLDGLEPLQYAPTSPLPGELKDQGIVALLKGLASISNGLCVITTRYALSDLRAFLGNTVHEETLTRLSTAASVALLQFLGVKGSLRKTIPAEKPLWNEYEQLVEDVKGHALTLNLLGSYLRDAHAGDIRQRDLVKLKEADSANEHPNHASHVMDAYVRWMYPTGFRAWLKRLFNAKEREIQVQGKRALALLQLLGLFDRPATADCLNALWQPPAIAGLTEPLVGLSEAQRNLSLKRLEDAKLLTVNRDAAGTLLALDAHPLLREYFSVRVRNGFFWSSLFRKLLHRIFPRISAASSAWREAHRQLYKHLCESTPDKPQPTLEDLQSLYQAVAHGCQAGLLQETCDKVLNSRIFHSKGNYSTFKLGPIGVAYGLHATLWFFEKPWSQLSEGLSKDTQAWLLSVAAFRLQARGQLHESLEPRRVGQADF